MGNCFSSFRQKREISVLFAGLDGAGKTTVVNKLAGLPINTVSPTVGLNTLKIKKGSYDINVLDLGGGERIRDIWKNYLAEAFGVVFLVDSSDTSRLDETKKVLDSLLNSKNVKGKPILIVANKQDKSNAMTADEIKAGIEMENFHNSHGGLYHILKHQLEKNSCQKSDGLRLFEIFENLKLINEKKCSNQLVSMILSSAIEGKKNKDSLNCGMKWLLDSIEEEFESLKDRVLMETEERDLQLQEEKVLRLERVKKRREEREEKERLQREEDGEPCSGHPHKIHVKKNLLEEAIKNCGKDKSDTISLNGEPCNGHEHKIHVKRKLLEDAIKNKGQNNCKTLTTNESQTTSSTEATKDLEFCSSTENQIANCKPPTSYVQFLNKCHSTNLKPGDTLAIHCDFESTNCTTTERSTSQICSTEEVSSNEVLVPVKEFPKGRKITPQEREILDKEQTQMVDDCFNKIDSKPSSSDRCDTASLELNIHINSHPKPRASHHPADIIHCPDVCYGHPETDLDTVPIKDQSNLIEDQSIKEPTADVIKHYGRAKKAKKRSLAERILKSQSSVKRSLDETDGGCVNKGFGDEIVDEHAGELPGSIIDDFVEVKSCESCRLNETEEDNQQNISTDLKQSSFDEGYCDDGKVKILDKEKKKKRKKRNKNKVKPLGGDIENQGILLPLKKPTTLPPLNLSSINRSFILNEELQVSKDEIKDTKEQVVVSNS